MRVLRRLGGRVVFATHLHELAHSAESLNADTPGDSKRARDFGAEGIGLTRTEHMFFEGERIVAVREMILADNAVVYPLVRRQHSYRPYWPDRIQGIVPNRHQGWDTWNAAWWWSPAAG